MGAWESFWFIMARAMEISLDLATPKATLGWLATVAGLCVLCAFRPRLGSFLTVWGAVLVFFIIWNHPDFAWYKHRPWDDGYAYAWAMVLVWVLVPVSLFRLGLRLWRRLVRVDWGERRRKARDAFQGKGD